MTDSAFSINTEVNKVDTELGLVIGTAIVCTQNGEPYFDKQGDHIPEDAMIEAATDFMLHGRANKNMHDGDDVGQVVFAFPLTTDIAKAYGIEASFTGLLVAVKPDAETLEKFRTGEYTGFSIGGRRIQNDPVEA